MPVLRQRGLLPVKHQNVTLRERIREQPGARLGADHPIPEVRPAPQGV